MMNQYYGSATPFGGRNPRGGERYDRAPYRRPMSRTPMTGRSCGMGNNGCGDRGRDEFRSGCGCGMGQMTTRNTEKTAVCGGNGGGCGTPRGGEQAATRGCGCSSLPAMRGNGCGCGNGNDSVSINCQKIMEQLRAVDFALYEVILYLDVYPHSCDALETYHKLKEQRDALCKEYESVCGPLTAFGNESGAAWNWIGSPFPWEYGAE